MNRPEIAHFLHISEDLLTKLQEQNITTTPSIASNLRKGYDFILLTPPDVELHRSIQIGVSDSPQGLKHTDIKLSRLHWRQHWDA